MPVKLDGLHDALLRYKIPEKMGRFEGHVDWVKNERVLTLMRSFRRAVIKKDSQFVRTVLGALQSATHADMSEHLTALVLNRSSAEPTKHALLTAICLGSRPLVEFILSLFYEFPGEENCGCRNSATFPPHMTPLMLACICNNYAIVQCLLLRKHSIDLPHRPDCICHKCKRSARTHANGVITLDTYRAISSGPFLWLACADPPLAAFKLALDLEACMQCEQEYRAIYEQLHRNVMLFAVRIIQNCWDMKEVDVLLSRKDGASLTDCQLRLPRLRLALDCRMKNFLSSVNVQSAMQTYWSGTWTDYGRHFWKDAWNITKHTLFYPITATVYSVTMGRHFKSFEYPFARYLSEMASYILFLVVLLFIRYSGRVGKHAADRSINENPVEVVLESYVYMYTIGMALRHYISLCIRGFSAFYEMWWSWFDLILLWLFSGACFCAMMTSATVGQDGLSKLHRRHWVYYDMSIIYDIYFGGACIMAFWRIFYYVQLRRNFGSTVVSVTRCVHDVVIFLAIMAVVMLCFAVGISCIYEPYVANKVEQHDGTLTSMKDTYAGIIITFRNLYWSFYGYLAPWDYKVVVGNAGTNSEPTEHIFTIIAGEVIVAIFHLTVVVALLNLMVTMLVKKADEVQRNEEWEWKYTRAHIYNEYFDWYSAVPPPFNLFYITARIINDVSKKKLVYAFPEVLVAQEALDVNADEALQERATYNTLLKELFGRYRCSKEYHYHTMLKSDAEKCLQNIQHMLNTPTPVLAFMNAEKPLEPH
uniref:Transient receptor ion channel domain-containing protein n=2 Tax=Ascaris TaxID=6251 RepID=A0A9J2P0L1_ASCLU